MTESTSNNKPRKRKRGLRLAILGLLLGAAIGVAKLSIEASVGNMLVEMLHEEAVKACNCSFQVDDVDFSLLQLSAKAYNARLTKAGADQIHVPLITATFNPILHIADKRIAITKLLLSDAKVYGIDSNSGAVQFIDHLAIPLPPEKQREWKIRVRLLNLEVADGHFTQPIGNGTIEGGDVSLLYQRDKRNNIRLSSSAETLEYRSEHSENNFSFGKIGSSLYIEDKSITFNDVALELGRSAIRFIGKLGTKGNTEVDGSLSIDLHTKDLPLATPIDGIIRGTGTIEGTKEALEASLRLQTPKEAPLYFSYADEQFGPYSLEGEIQKNVGDPPILTKLSSLFDTGEMRLSDPLTLSSQGAEGIIEFQFQELRLPQTTLINGDLQLSLTPNDTVTTTTLSGSIGGVRVEDYLIPKLRVSAKYGSGGLDIQLQHPSSSLGSALINARVIDVADNPVIETFSFSISNLALLSLQEHDYFEVENLILFSANGALAESPTSSSLEGNGQLTIAAPSFIGESALRGPFSLASGIFDVELSNASSSITLDAHIPVNKSNKEGKLRATLTGFKPQEYKPELSCITTTLIAEYGFSAKTPYQGNGSVNLSELTLGCVPYQTHLAEPTSLKISQGAIELSDIRFRSQDSDLILSGLISHETLNLKANGDVLLRSLLPVAPFLDDLSGSLAVEVAASGTINAPEVSGIAKIQDGAFALESGDLSGNSITGELELSPEQVTISHAQGRLNGGKTELSGQIDLTSLTESTLSFSFDQAFYQFADNAHAVLSGFLNFGLNELATPVLQGTIEIDSSELVQEFDVRDLVSQFSQSILFRSTESPTRDSAANLPPIELDIQLIANRNMIVITSFFGTELAGEVAITGELDKPRINGSVQTLRGWLGLREARFEITSGKIIFADNSNYAGTTLSPQLSIIAESYVRGNSGENILVLLEVDGSLLNPNVRLSSDRGDSEREILALLGARSDFRISSASLSSSEQLEIGSWNRTNEDRSFWEKFVTNVTTIDSISLEPKFNARRGQLEPALVAQKSLVPEIDLLGESFLSSPEDGSQLFLRYRLFPKVQLLGSIDTINAEQRTSLGADIAFTVLSREKKQVDIVLEGNKALSRKTILEAARLSDQSRIDPASLDSLTSILESFYADQGYFSAKIHLTCESPIYFCEQLRIAIEEGAQSSIHRVHIVGDSPPKTFTKDLPQIPLQDQIASKTLLETLSDTLIRQLRSDGYLQSRAKLTYVQISDDSIHRELRIDLSKGKAVTISFTGNTLFSDRQLLETINLFERRQPFGNNTIYILARNIEQLYRENGYLLASVQVLAEQTDDNERKNYLVTIREENPISVSQVEFIGISPSEKEKLFTQYTADRDSIALQQLLSPKYAINEEMQKNDLRLTESLSLLGYPNALVRHAIHLNDSEPTVTIEYRIELGERVFADTMHIHATQLDVILPKAPPAPYSIPKANRYISEIVTLLEDYGYFQSSLWTELIDGEMILHIEQGEQDRIIELSILGNNSISEEEILRHIDLRIDQPVRRVDIQRAKRRLLRLGLFSRVDSKRTHLESGGSVVQFVLQERPLQTLEFGGGLNSEFGFHLFGEGSDRELFADGRSLSLRFDTFYDDTAAEIGRGLASVRYTNPTLFDSEIQHTEDIRFQKVDLSIQEFNLNRLSLASYLANTDNALSWSIGHNIFVEDLEDVTPGAIIDESLDSGNVLLSLLTGTVGYDKRDSQLNPLSGYAAKVEGSLAHEAFGSDASYVGLNGRASYLEPFSIGQRRFGIAVSVRGAATWGLGSTETIPITQRYYLGGRTTVRGFRENSLGPKGEDNAVIGGDLLALINTEFRYYPSEIFSIHTFLDSGTVFLQDRTLSADELRYGAGIGFRYLSPIGPIGFDVGAPLNQEAGEPSARLHFSIGSTF